MTGSQFEFLREEFPDEFERAKGLKAASRGFFSAGGNFVRVSAIRRSDSHTTPLTCF